MCAVQLNSSEPPPAATMQIQMSAAQAAEAAHASPGGLSALLSDPAQLQQVEELHACGYSSPLFIYTVCKALLGVL